MKKKLFLFFLFLGFSAPSLLSQGMRWKPNESLFCAGFRITLPIPLTRTFSDDWTATRVFAPGFGGYLRVGKKIFGEIGIGYAFQKNRFAVEQGPGIYAPFEDIVELRFLQIPMQLVGEFRIRQIYSLQPAVGLIYQPLLQLSQNWIGFSKNDLAKHYFVWTVGLTFTLYFFSFELSFRQFLQNWVPESSVKKPSYLSFSVGFQI